MSATPLISSVLIGIGSNDDAEFYLPIAYKGLARLGRVELSSALVNPDFTATADCPKPDYTNQCAYLLLRSPLSKADLVRQFRLIEARCGRTRSKTTPYHIEPKDHHMSGDYSDIGFKEVGRLTQSRRVSLDIDLLAVRYEKGSRWLIIDKRLPFKAHEVFGLKQLVATQAGLDCPELTTHLHLLSPS